MDKSRWLKPREVENKRLEELIDKPKNMSEDEYYNARFGININEFHKPDKESDVL